MKILLILFIGLFANIAEVKHTPYSKTGHEQFAELEFENANRQLLVEMTDFFIELNLRDVKSRFWGESTEYYCIYEDAGYVGETVFSRSNKTREPFDFKYSLTEVDYYERSVYVEGSVTVDGKIKKDNVERKGKVEIEAGLEIEESKRTTEKEDMEVTVYPNKKISLRVAGEAKISSGFTKNYLFWVCVKKGAWETVDVVTSYFELVEEDA